MTASPPDIAWPCPVDTVPLRDLWRWERQGVRRLIALERDGWRRRDLRAVLLRKTARRMAAFFRRFPNVSIQRQTAEMDPPSAWLEWIASEKPAIAPRTRPLQVLHYISALYAGGAERQVCNLVIATARRGIATTVWTAFPPEGECGHYAPLLREASVPLRTLRPRPLSPQARVIPWRLLQHIPEELRIQTAMLTTALVDERPDVLHCWLDDPNLVGAIAGLLTGVPTIILSTRNGNPTNFPRLHCPYQQAWYRIAASSSRVHFIANSRAGAASYAEWIGIPESRFHVIANGFVPDQFPTADAETRRAARASFGLSSTDRVVCGVFRLADEKRPFVFLDVVRRVKGRVPNLRVLLAGDGDRAATVAEVIRSTGLSDTVRMLGRCRNVGRVLLASDVCLLTSMWEGCPNVALESQHLGVPIVATRAGGTVDTVAHDETGLLAEVDDVAGLAEHVTRLLSDETERLHFAQAGPAFVANRFGCDRMVDETLALYRHLPLAA